MPEYLAFRNGGASSYTNYQLLDYSTTASSAMILPCYTPRPWDDARCSHVTLRCADSDAASVTDDDEILHSCSWYLPLRTHKLVERRVRCRCPLASASRYSVLATPTDGDASAFPEFSGGADDISSIPMQFFCFASSVLAASVQAVDWRIFRRYRNRYSRY